MTLKYFIQLPSYNHKEKARLFLEALETMNEEQFMMFSDDIKIFPYDPDTDEVIVTNVELKDAVKLWKEQYKNKQKVEKQNETV